MALPIKPLLANLFMEEFEAKVISSDPIQPGSGLCRWRTPSSSNRLNIVTSSSSTSTLLTPTSSSPWKIPKMMFPYLFLVSPGPYNTLMTSIYRKSPTWTNTFTGTANTTYQPNTAFTIFSTHGRVVCTSLPGVTQEEDHIRQVILRCNYPP